MQHAPRPRRWAWRILLRLAGRGVETATKPMPPAHEGVAALASVMPVDGGWWMSTVGTGE